MKKYVIDGRSQLSGTLSSGKTVILSMKEGVYYGLEGVGARVWQLLQQPQSIEEIVNRLAKDYIVAEDRLRQDVSQLLEDMTDHGIVEVQETHVGHD